MLNLTKVEMVCALNSRFTKKWSQVYVAEVNWCHHYRKKAHTRMSSNEQKLAEGSSYAKRGSIYFIEQK